MSASYVVSLEQAARISMANELDPSKDLLGEGGSKVMAYGAVGAQSIESLFGIELGEGFNDDTGLFMLTQGVVVTGGQSDTEGFWSSE